MISVHSFLCTQRWCNCCDCDWVSHSRPTF